MTLAEMRAIMRAVLSEHECRADRYFAYAALWDVVGYLQLGEDRGIPVSEAPVLRREVAALLPMLDPSRVPDEHVAVQLALARLHGLREQPARVIEVGGAIAPRGEVRVEVIRASGEGGATGSGSASPTIVAWATGSGRTAGTASPTVVSSGSGGGAPPTPPGEGPPPGIGVRSRQPTFAEAQASGMLAELDAGRRRWWEHHHYPLRDGRWGAQVHVFEDDGQGLDVTPLYPPPSAGYFATPQEAREHDTRMARWYFTVNAPSPSTPLGSTAT